MNDERRNSPLGRRSGDKLKGTAAVTGVGAGGISLALMLYMAQSIGMIEEKLSDIQQTIGSAGGTHVMCVVPGEGG